MDPEKFVQLPSNRSRRARHNYTVNAISPPRKLQKNGMLSSATLNDEPVRVHTEIFILRTSSPIVLLPMRPIHTTTISNI